MQKLQNKRFSDIVVLQAVGVENAVSEVLQTQQTVENIASTMLCVCVSRLKGRLSQESIGYLTSQAKLKSAVSRL